MQLFGDITKPYLMAPRGSVRVDLDTKSPLLMMGQLESMFQDIYHGLSMQQDQLEALRNAVTGVESDDIDVTTDPASGRSYWSVQRVFEGLSDLVAASSFDWSVISFGAEVVGSTTLRIYTGEVYMRLAHATISQTDVTIAGGTAGSPHYAYLRIDADDTDLSTATIPTAALSWKPAPNSTYWQVPICSAYHNGSNVAIVQRHQLGDIYVPGLYSA